MRNIREGEGPLVSILTPSLDQAAFIGDCIESVARQTYRALEHIVCDGGSTDGTVDVLVRAPHHVRWVSEPDRGQADALNKAFRLSAGDIIGWVNSDDAYADRRAVEWAVDALNADPSLDAVCGHALLVNERNEVLQVIWTPTVRKSLLRLAHYVYQPTLFVRRSAIENGEQFVRDDLDFVFDRDLVLRLMRAGGVRRLDRVLACDRHQRHRKVETQAFLEEALAYDTALGLRPSRRRITLRRVFTGALRLAGLSRVLRLQRELVPAVDLVWLPLQRRLRLQAATPRRLMPF